MAEEFTFFYPSGIPSSVILAVEDVFTGNAAKQRPLHATLQCPWRQLGSLIIVWEAP